MLLSHKHKFVTIDIPKTGTRSFRETLNKNSIVDIIGGGGSQFNQHAGIKEIRDIFIKNGWNIKDYFCMAVVRNPWNRYFSFFNYFKEYGEKYLKRDASINWGKAEISQGQRSASLFQDSNQSAMREIIKTTVPQHSYYSIEGEIKIDHIAVFENINDEFAFFCKKNGIEPLKLCHSNNSKKTLNIEEVFDDSLIDLVYKKEKPVIENFGYSFNVEL